MDPRPAFRSVPVPPVAEDSPLQPVHGPQAWFGPDLARKPEDWTYSCLTSAPMGQIEGFL